VERLRDLGWIEDRTIAIASWLMRASMWYEA
jgi:hypothetical protein